MTGALRWDVDGLDWPHRSASSFVEAGGLRWHVQRLGAGPPVLLIHGTGASSHSWRDVLPLLAQDFSCVAIDLPGHAFTGMPPPNALSLPGMARRLAALLKALEVSPAMIVGHSAGAAIAAQLALQEDVPAAAIVGINGAFLPLSGMAGLIFPPAARVMASNSIAARLFAWRARDRGVAHRLIEQTGSELDARGEELYARLVRNPVHVSAALGMMARWDVAPVVAALPRLDGKLVLIAGARDRAVPPSQSQSLNVALENSSLAIIEQAGHLAHEERPAEVAALVREAWRDLPAEQRNARYALRPA